MASTFDNLTPEEAAILAEIKAAKAEGEQAAQGPKPAYDEPDRPEPRSPGHALLRETDAKRRAEIERGMLREMHRGFSRGRERRYGD